MRTRPAGNPSSAYDASKTTSSRSKRRRRIFLVSISGTVIILGLAGSAWLGFKATTIRNELNAVGQLIPKLKEDVFRNDAVAAASGVADLQEHTSKAREAAADPLWTVAGAMPWIGNNFQAAREVATTADDVARLGAAPLVTVLQSLDWKSLVPKDQGVDLKPLAAAAPKISSAANAVRQSSDRLNAIESDALIPQISDPLAYVREQLASLRVGLDAAADAASVLPGMMGAQSPRHYLLIIQNNAESRATGGIPGALAVLTVDKGKLSLGSQTSAAALGAFDPAVEVDPEQESIYTTRIGKFMQDVNFTPDFPTAARTAQVMWERKMNQRLDGALSIDPVALGYILEATGPVNLSDPALAKLTEGKLPMELTAKNAMPTLLSEVYSKISEPSRQDAYFAGVARNVFSRLSSGGSDPEKLVQVLTRGASERRVLLWSAARSEQAVIAQYPVGGAIAGDSISPSQFGVYFNDGTGAKMDYYVKRTVQLQEECTSDGYRQVTVRITSKNTAPSDAATSLPAYVTGAGVFGVPTGSVQTNIVAYGPVQSNIEEVSVGGKKTGFASNRHADRPVGTATVRIAPGQTSTVQFSFGKIVQHSVPAVSVSPTVQSLKDVILKSETTNCSAPSRSVH